MSKWFEVTPKVYANSQPRVTPWVSWKI